MIILTVTQDPGAIEPVTVNFDTVLEPDGEHLASVAWTVEPGLTIGSGAYGPALSPDLRKATVWFRGGVADQAYVANAHFVTDHIPPRADDVQVIVQIQET